MFPAAVAIVFCAARLLGAQAQQPPPTPPAPAPVEKPALVPGELPADATPQAREAWLAVVKATSGATAQPRVTGFDLLFEGRARPAGRESHDFDDARYRYREPGWIHTTLKDGSERLRGPRGDWFVKQGTATRLQGADFANDTRELDEQARVAHSFVNLIDLRSLRLQSLALAVQPPAAIPLSLRERAQQLRWLEAVSPDFQQETKENLVRAWIGVDAATHLPQLAMVARDDRGTIVHETALLVKLDKWLPLDGFQVPHELRSYEPVLSRSPWTFDENASLSLWLKSGTLRPSLTEADFLPPEKR